MNVSGILLVFIAAPIAIATVTGAAVWLIASAGRGIPEQYRGLAGLRRAVGAARLVAVVLGVVTFFVVGGVGDLGRGWMLAPIAAGGVALVALTVGELAARSTSVTPGVAALEVRSLRDHLPRMLTIGTVIVLTALLGFLALATLVGAPDDMGRAGRTLTQTCSPNVTHSVGPWPGSYYAVPLVVALAAFGAVAAVAYRTVVRRPRNGSDPWIVAVDNGLRRSAVEAIAGVVAIVVAITMVGIAGTMAMGVGNLASADCLRTASMTSLGWIAGGGIVLGLVLFVWGCGALGLSARTSAATMRKRPDHLTVSR